MTTPFSRLIRLALAALLSVAPLAADAQSDPPATVETGEGILNPDDIGRDMLVRKIEMGVTDSVTCSLAINTSKYDDHALARRLATRCAEAGSTKAMTWMSHFETNGIGGPVDLAAAAIWDRRAAEAGDPVGMYNLGLSLMRARGVEKDEAEGRRLIDRAAAAGLDVARQLQALSYDLDQVTPDAETVD